MFKKTLIKTQCFTRVADDGNQRGFQPLCSKGVTWCNVFCTSLIIDSLAEQGVKSNEKSGDG